MSNQNDNTLYAAAEARELLDGTLNGKDRDDINPYAGLIDDENTLRLLNYYQSLWRDKGDEEFTASRLGHEIVTSAATRTIDGAYREGNVSQLKGAVGLTNQSKDGEEALTKMARLLANEGFIGLVVGPPGAGKTAMTLDISRIWAALTGGHVVSNIRWDGAEHITSSAELLDAMGSVDGRVLGVIDEGSQSLTSRGAEAQQADKFAKMLKYIRKKQSGDRFAKQGSVVIVGHTRKDTAADIRRLASGMWEKPTRQDPGRVRLLDSEGGRDSFEESAEYRGVTDTAERYDEHEASSFRVVERGEEDNEEESGPSEEEVRRDEAIRVAVRACQPWTDETGMSYPDAAALVGYSDSWVGDRVREWKRGEHRNIVSGPEGETA